MAVPFDLAHYLLPVPSSVLPVSLEGEITSHIIKLETIKFPLGHEAVLLWSLQFAAVCGEVRLNFFYIMMCGGQSEGLFLCYGVTEIGVCGE